MARPLTINIPTPHGGILSVLAVLWLTGLATAAVWYLTGVGYGLLTLAVVGSGALFAADEMIFGDESKRPGGRR